MFRADINKKNNGFVVRVFTRFCLEAAHARNQRRCPLLSPKLPRRVGMCRLNTRIAVGMAFFGLLLAPLSVYSAEASLSWRIPDSDRVTGYRIYYGPAGADFKTAPKQTINSKDRNNCDIAGLDPGQTYGFTMTSIDGSGNESDFSEILFFRVPDESDDSEADEGDPESAPEDDSTEEERTGADNRQETGGEKDSETAPGGTAESGGNTTESDSSQSPSGEESDSDNRDAAADDGDQGGEETPAGSGGKTTAGDIFTGLDGRHAETPETYYAFRVSGGTGLSTQLLALSLGESNALIYEELATSGNGPASVSTPGYTLDADGRMSVEGGIRGVVSKNNTYVAAGRTAVDDEPSLVFGIRRSEGLQAADLEGRYMVFVGTNTTGRVTIDTGTLQADGAGGVKNINGAGFDAAYTVDGRTGGLVFYPDASGGSIKGLLSPDADVFFVVDTDGSDDTLLFGMGIRAGTNIDRAGMAGRYVVNRIDCKNGSAPAAFFQNMVVTDSGDFAIETVESSGAETPSAAYGRISPAVDGWVEATESGGTRPFVIGVSPGNAAAILAGQQFIGVGFRQASAENGGEVPSSGTGRQMAAGGGSSDDTVVCFIRTALSAIW